MFTLLPEVMNMREEKQKQQSKSNPSPKKKLHKQPWFWPTIYASIAVVLIALVITYSIISNNNEKVAKNSTDKNDKEVVVETNSKVETLKYPFNEEHLNEVKILQDFYDVTADEQTRENALLVFNQTFSTSSGVSLSINEKPFEVLAALSGEVVDVKLDAFTGNQIIIKHPNGMETRYSSVTDILVKKGDSVVQGQPIATTTSNEWNPTAGIHLHFEILEDGKHVNPRNYLAF